MESISSRVVKTEEVKWRLLQFLQQDTFKDFSEESKKKLKTSLLANQFTQPFYVWQDDEGLIYCLDGRHRFKILEELITEGNNVPELLPAVFIKCENKQEASKLVLIYSSIYARINQQGLMDFLKLSDLDYEFMKLQMDIPDFNTPRFEQKFDVYGVNNDNGEVDELEPSEDNMIVKSGDLFQLNGHRIICGSFSDKNITEQLLEKEQARIVFCDPPYNLPTSFFSNQNHLDFKQASGEMTDKQFMEFLASVMLVSRQYTIDGAIHYICMDWRHVWHMTEAAKKVYGSPEPKQVCVWNKDIMANGSFYRSKQELVFIFQNGNAQALWNNDLLDHSGFYKNNNELVFIFKNGDEAKHLSHLELQNRIRTNVWNYPSATSTKNPDRYELKNHPTPKPVQMVADAVLDTTNEGDLVIDWFMGSGTTLIASEKTKRKCYGTEIEPKYVQHEITRYKNYCNQNGIKFQFKHLNGSLKIEDFK